MARNDILKRSLDAGVTFTALTQARAEALVRDLVRAGEVQADQARDVVTDLVERSRQNTERLLELIRGEVRAQVVSLGLVRQADLDRIERRIQSVLGTAVPVMKAAPTAEKPAAKDGPAPAKAPAKKKKAPAKKAPAKKKAAPKKAPAKKKAAAKKAPAKKKAAAKKAPAVAAERPPSAPTPSEQPPAPEQD